MKQHQEIPCRHFASCSGCVHQNQVDQLALFKEAEAFFRERDLSLPPLVTGPAVGWCHRAKLAVARADKKNIAIGLYRFGTHIVEEIPHCLVHHPRIQQALFIIQSVLEELSIAPYEEKRQSGLLRYLLIALEEETQSIQLSFVATARSPSFWEPCIKRLVEKDPTLWHSIWLNHNARVDNVIWGEDWDLLWGKPWLHTEVGMAQMALHPGCFFQANVPLFRALVEELTLWVPRNCHLLELYSGCGVMGLHLAAARQCSVICCERNPLSRSSFEASLARMPLEIKQNMKIEFRVEDAEAALFLLEEAKAVLVDPPRKGLTPSMMESLGACQRGTELFYVSCGWKAFMRDCDALCARGWRLKRAKSFLFFPGTEQIELLVHMEKLGSIT